MSKYYLTSSLNELSNVGANTSITRINTKLKTFDNEWTSKEIDERQQMLIDLASEIWTIQPLTD